MSPGGQSSKTYLLTIVVKTIIFPSMTTRIAQELKQKAPFSSLEQEVFLGLRLATARVVDPWATFLKTAAELSLIQYNVLRILRGSHPDKLACSAIADRLVSRDPDITRLVDRLSKRGLVKRSPGRKDRRVVEVSITKNGLEVLGELDAHAQRMPRAFLGQLGTEKLRQLRSLLEAVDRKSVV